MCKCLFIILLCLNVFLGICTIFSDALGPFLTISAAGHAGVPHIHDGASLGPRRAPWRVLWALKVAKAGNNHGVDFRGVIAEQDNGKPHVSHFSVRSNTVTTIASNFPRSYSYGHYYACVITAIHAWSWCICVYALCVCSVYVCACARVCPWRMLALGCCVSRRTRTVHVL